MPYHNRTHAADVVSRLSAILYVDDTIGSEETVTSKCTIYAAILAAVIHDYDHPGFDNNFQATSHGDMHACMHACVISAYALLLL